MWVIIGARGGQGISRFLEGGGARMGRKKVLCIWIAIACGRKLARNARFLFVKNYVKW